MKHIRRLLLASSLLAGLILVSLFALLESNWISQRIRQGIIQGVEDATGARVEIPVFRWDWRTLTVEMQGFTMHGFEPAAEAPLFTSPLIRIRLRILSLFDGNVQVTSLVLTRPRFHLIVGPNGSTNVPGPKHVISPREIVDTLLTLKLPHIEVTQGLAQFNSRQFPVSLLGEHVSLLVRYRTAERRYELALQSPNLRLGSEKMAYFDGSVNAGGQLWRDHFHLAYSRFHSRSADVAVSGTLYEFNNPVIDWRLTSTFATSETLRSFGLKNMTGDGISISGLGHHDPQTPLFFDARLSAHHLSATAAGFAVKNASVSSRVVLDSNTVRWSDLLVSSPEGRFSGSGSLAGFRDLQISGDYSQIDLQPVASSLLRKQFPWSATVSGKVDISASVQPALHDLKVTGSLNLAERDGGIPLSGQLRYQYRQRERAFALQDADVRTADTHLTATGDLTRTLSFDLDSTNLADLNPGLSLFGAHLNPADFPSLQNGGSVHLQGSADLSPTGLIRLQAALDLTRVKWRTTVVDGFHSAFEVSPSELQLKSLTVQAPLLRGSATGVFALSDWHMMPNGRNQVSGNFSQVQIGSLADLIDPAFSRDLTGGLGSGVFALTGPWDHLQGSTQLNIRDVTLRGEHLDAVTGTLALSRNQLSLSRGQIQSGSASLALAGAYRFGDSPRIPLLTTGSTNGDSPWHRGTLQLNLDSNRFPFSRLGSLLPGLPALEAQSELHAQIAVSVAPGHIAPLSLSGTAALHRILFHGVPLGDADAAASTQGQTIEATLNGNFRGSKITGVSSIQIAPDTPARGKLTFEPVTLATLTSILQSSKSAASLLSGSARGAISFDGPLQSPSKLHALLRLQDLQISGPPLRQLGQDLSSASVPASTPSAAPELILQSSTPVVVEITSGVAAVRSAHLTGRDTQLSISGTAGLQGAQPVQLALHGGIDLRLLQLLYPDLQTGGQSKIDAAVTGTIADPQLSGAIAISNASLFSPLAPNGLSNLTGTIRFDQHRATLERVSAHTGGGTITFGGFVTYSANHPLVYRLDSTGQNIRLRYANGISIAGNTQFSLTGTSEQSLLSGGITIDRVVLNPNADLGNLLALTSAPVVSTDSSKDYLSRLQMDIHIESAPNLQFDTALSTGVQAELDLELRGTPKQPILLGSIEANQGDIKVFGSRYSINRGQISFVNSARLEPVLDLDLQTQARGITVDITIAGTLNKLNIDYRSDPPLQPRDIIALLTVGRTPQSTSTESNVQATNDASSLQSGANSVLGQAIAPVSNRLSKLFGITNIKIDPLVQGITNTPQARLTLEQQISRQITVTYITNLSQTSEQIFRLEYALNPQFSLIALRDDNGEFGIDILYKKRFK